MIAGTISKVSREVIASATSISPVTDLVKITGSTAIATIVPPLGAGHHQFLMLVAVDGSVGLLTSGNIAVAVTMAQNRLVVLAYDYISDVWYPGAIS
jgi:hypothetical protein